MKTKLLLGLASTWLITGSSVFASQLTSLPGANFGGTGIANSNVVVTTIDNAGDTITLGLAATPRYPNPPVGGSLPNDGIETFYATPGVVNGKATWNFDYYISVNNGDFANYTFELFYGTSLSSLVQMSSGPVSIAQIDQLSSPYEAYTTSGGTTIAQDSETLSFSYLGTPIGFDPNANGQYIFELEAFDDGTEIGSTAINVDVSAVPDVTSTALLLGLGLGTLLVFGYRQNRLQTA